MSFLKPVDVRNVQITCMRLHSICREQHVWLPHAARIWPVLKHAMKNIGQKVCLVDNYHDRGDCPDAAVVLDNENTINMSLVHGISVPHPISIHNSFFTKRKDFVIYSNKKKEVLVKFAGDVGFGDRSIISNIPFPNCRGGNYHSNQHQHQHRWPRSILEMLCRGKKDGVVEGLGFAGPNSLR